MCSLCLLVAAITATTNPSVNLKHDEEAKKLVIRIDGQPAVTYQYGEEFALPHYFPLLSPSGKSLTVQRPDPYPHHRSLWIADKVQGPEGPEVDFYHCWKNQRDPNDAAAGFRHSIRHRNFDRQEVDGRTGAIETHLQWVVNEDIPILEEHRTLRFVALGSREYFIDLTWRLSPSTGEVKFLSDRVHYAWPYVRMHPQFSGDQGAVITNDQGNHGQAGTHDKPASWIDYSNTIGGVTEGLTVFVDPDAPDPLWLTREYGTFGPRRAEKLSGTKFILRPGESLSGRVGILVHQGDVAIGRVAERYRQYVEGEL